MRRKRILSVLLAATCVLSLLSGCGNGEASGRNEKTSGDGATVSDSGEEASRNDTENTGNSGTGSGEHEPITMMYSVTLDNLINAVHEKYPEINLVQIPYGGGNGTWYTVNQLRTGEMPDIYNSSMAWMPDADKMEENLVDLSACDFTDNFLPTQIRDMEVNGKVYLIPSNYNVYAIGYNKTLFEKHGWTIPDSFEELKAMAPEIEAAGVELAQSNLTAAGFAFQYLCNLADTQGLADVDGVQWQKEFLKGEASAEDGFGKGLDYMQEWVDLGMIKTTEQTAAQYGIENPTPFEIFAEGNTAFFIGPMGRMTQNKDGSGDEFAMLPYLSQDGSKNKVIINVSRVFGINKELEKPGNEQKLEDALHVLEVIASEEGQNALNRGHVLLNSLKGVSVEESSPYYTVVKEVNDGNSAPFLYAGWTNVIVSMGENIIKFCNGELTRDETLAAFDEAMQDALTNGVPVYAHAEETLDLDTMARMVGQAFCEEVGADCALVSEDALREDGNIQNGKGVSGTILPVDIDDEYLAVFTPGGRNGKITTVTLTGKRIKEVQKQGFDTGTVDAMVDSGLTANFPYALVTREGFTLDDDTEYTVVVCGITDQLREEGNAIDTDVSGMEALKNYFKRLGNPMHLTAKDIEWK